MLYAAVLVAELGVLGALLALFGREAPWTGAFGYAAAASFIAMQVYSLRRRWVVLHRSGALERWLDVHVFLGLQGVLFTIYHAKGLRPARDLVTAIAVIVLVLAVTGVAGRYVAPLRRHAMWSLVHRPLAFVLASLVTLHVVSHVAYAR